jgi:hypothetical protein
MPIGYWWTVELVSWSVVCALPRSPGGLTAAVWRICWWPAPGSAGSGRSPPTALRFLRTLWPDRPWCAGKTTVRAVRRWCPMGIQVAARREVRVQHTFQESEGPGEPGCSGEIGELLAGDRRHHDPFAVRGTKVAGEAVHVRHVRCGVAFAGADWISVPPQAASSRQFMRTVILWLTASWPVMGGSITPPFSAGRRTGRSFRGKQTAFFVCQHRAREGE